MPAHLPEDVALVVEQSNKFAAGLYSKLAQEATGNLFFSPSSITVAFAMTFAGAAGETAKEMAEVFGFSLPTNRLHPAFHELHDATRTGGVELRLANRLWGQKGYHFFPEFMEICNRYYGAAFGEVDFRSAAASACRDINQWVEDQTNGKIKNLVTPATVNAMTRLVLTNAIYFLGCWEHEFDEDRTTLIPFWLGPNTHCSIPMMQQTDYFEYGEFDGVQVLELPYQHQQIELQETERGNVTVVEPSSGGSDLAMSIVLPRAPNGLIEVESRLSTSALNKWLALETHRVQVFLPKFRIESAISLAETLTMMGMVKAFSQNKADFSRMSNHPEGLFIAAVLHKAFVDVNEKGTEAAAATAVIMAGRGVSREPDPKVFRADHPFLFLIRDRKTALIHFMGRITGLSQDQT